MRLIKSCNPEHNIRTSSTAKLQVGSYYFYKQHENLEIKDEGEATNKLYVDIRGPFSISAANLNALTGGQFVSGTDQHSSAPRLPAFTRIKVQCLRVRRDGDPVIVDEARFEIERSLPNGFVFCMSLTDENQTSPLFESYSDSWSLPFEKSGLFAWHLSRMMTTQLQPEWIEPKLQQDIESGKISLDQVTVEVHDRAILYTDRHITLTAGDEEKINGVFSIIRSLAFTKPPRYSRDREYRFLLNVIAEHANGTKTIYAPAAELVRLTPDIPWVDLD
ncbi:hypothetical protein [Bordetella muralis]|uniref:hypothetical protein n=1 Tax=Bordetella muralis TaxID=1649130 RepID=UPI0039EE3909